MNGHLAQGIRQAQIRSSSRCSIVRRSPIADAVKVAAKAHAEFLRSRLASLVQQVRDLVDVDIVAWFWDQHRLRRDAKGVVLSWLPVGMEADVAEVLIRLARDLDDSAKENVFDQVVDNAIARSHVAR